MAPSKKFSIKGFYAAHPIISNLLIMIAVALILLWGVLLFLEAILAANGLSIEISDSIYDRSVAPGTVVESWPKAGAIVKGDRAVFVTLTAFSPKQVTISMPLTGNVSSRQAASYLRGIGITDVRMVHVPSPYADLVVGARYGDTPLTVGTVIPVTSTVTLEVGSGPAASDSDSLHSEPEPALDPEFGDIYE